MISNDVNVIFSYLDVDNKFHKKSGLFVKLNQRRKYVLLAKVHKSFLKTYQNLVKLVGVAITQKVLYFKNQERYLKKTKDFVNKLIEIEIDKELKNISSKYPTYSIDSLNDFKNLLLAEYSLLELFYEDEAIGEFRERFIKEAQDYSIKGLNKFLYSFKNFELMKLNMYRKYDEFLKNINMKDYEDKLICAELFSFGEEKGRIKFLTYDKNFNNYLKRNGKEHRVDVLTINLKK